MIDLDCLVPAGSSHYRASDVFSAVPDSNVVENLAPRLAVTCTDCSYILLDNTLRIPNSANLGL